MSEQPCMIQQSRGFSQCHGSGAWHAHTILPTLTPTQAGQHWLPQWCRLWPSQGQPACGLQAFPQLVLAQSGHHSLKLQRPTLTPTKQVVDCHHRGRAAHTSMMAAYSVQPSQECSVRPWCRWSVAITEDMQPARSLPRSLTSRSRQEAPAPNVRSPCCPRPTS